MTKSSLSLHKLSALLLVAVSCAVWSLPVSDDVDFVRELESASEVVRLEEKANDDENPIYEFQLAVWPDEDLADSQNTVQHAGDTVYAPQFEEQEVVFPDLGDVAQGDQISIPIWQKPQVATKPTKPTKTTPQGDLMAAIFPEIHFDEAEAIADHHDDEDEDVDLSLTGGVQQFGSVTTPKPVVPKPHVEVVEQYQTVHPNGTTEYKLVLSNGMTNYKKIYNKLMPDGKVVTVQEGYDSVPIPGDDPYSNEFQTQFYIADEHGHNVYRVEKHTRKPHLPEYLDYKQQLGQFLK